MKRQADASASTASTDDVNAGTGQTPSQELTVPLQWAGQRLDKALVGLFPDYTRARLQDWLEAGRITVNGAAGLKASLKLRGGEALVLTPQPPEHMQTLQAQALEFDVVHEDEHCVVVNKPAGLVVHPAAGHWDGTLMNGLLHRYPELIDVPRAGIVHRLDKDTTGLMVVARRADVQQTLIRQMARRRIRRIYLALCWGRMTQRRTVDAPIGRDPRNRQKMAVVPHGKPATTHFYPLALGTLAELPVTLLACKLETGRTHQIRVHALQSGFGLVGDQAYRQRGARPVPLLRQSLHATYLAFSDSEQADWEVKTIAPLPEDFAALLQQAGIVPPDDERLLTLPELWPQEATATAEATEDDEWDDEDSDVEIIYVREDE